MAVINKTELTEDNYKKYIEVLVNKIYQLLPIYEGRDGATKEIVFINNEAYKQFRQRCIKLLTEIRGLCHFIDSIGFIKISNMLAGMTEIGLDKHDQVKACVFECIELLKKEL